MVRLLLSQIVLATFCGTLGAEPIKVFVMAGQSNCVGGAWPPEPPKDLARPQADVLYDFALGVTAGAPLEPPGLMLMRPLWPTYFPASYGAELTLGQELARRTGEKIAIVKTAKNGNGLETSWKPSRGDLYPWMVREVHESLTELEGHGWEPEVAGFIWIQGETDSAWPVWAEAYGANLTDLFNAVRSEFGDMPIVLNELHAGTWPSWLPDRPEVATMKAQQRMVGQNLDSVSVVNTDDLPLSSDNLHFSPTMHLELGRRLADALIPSGDFNADGVADAGDLDVWRSSYGVDELGDGNADGVTDGQDFLAWQRQLRGAQAVSIPEPSTAALTLYLVAGLALAWASRRATAFSKVAGSRFAGR